jgi:hypothetical protein
MTQQKPQEKLEGLFDAAEFYAEDLAQTLKAVTTRDTAYNRRVYCLMVVLSFEATGNAWKSWIVTKHRKQMSAAEVALCDEQDHVLSVTGDIKPKPIRGLDVVGNIRFALRMVTTYGAVPEVRLQDDPRWAALGRSVLARHKIAHPRHDRGVSISDAEMEDLRQANSLFDDCTRQIKLAFTWHNKLLAEILLGEYAKMKALRAQGVSSSLPSQAEIDAGIAEERADLALLEGEIRSMGGDPAKDPYAGMRDPEFGK